MYPEYTHVFPELVPAFLNVISNRFTSINPVGLAVTSAFLDFLHKGK